MRYDRGFRGYDRGWMGAGQGSVPRYDQVFRANRPGYDYGYHDRGRAVRDGETHYGPQAPRGMTAHPSDNQHVGAGETDFLGRPYPRAAQEDVPWGLISQERIQRERGTGDGLLPGRGTGFRGERGYDRQMMGNRGYDAGMMRGGHDRGGYDRGGMQSFRPGNGPGGMQGGGMQGGGMQGGGMQGGYRGGNPGGYGEQRVAGMRYGGSYGGDWGYDRDMRPEDFHARNLPDSDEAGVDLRRLYRGRDLRHTSDWTRWF